MVPLTVRANSVNCDTASHRGVRVRPRLLRTKSVGLTAEDFTTQFNDAPLPRLSAPYLFRTVLRSLRLAIRCSSLDLNRGRGIGKVLGWHLDLVALLVLVPQLGVQDLVGKRDDLVLRILCVSNTSAQRPSQEM